jgi:hypothetical protein
MTCHCPGASMSGEGVDVKCCQVQTWYAERSFWATGGGSCERKESKLGIKFLYPCRTCAKLEG